MIPLAMPFGHGAFDFRLEADVLLPRLDAPVPDEMAAIVEALEHPFGSPTLDRIVRPGEKVAVVVNDITRLARTDLMLPPLVAALNRAGIPDTDILVVFALGNHRRQTDEERKRILGEEMYHRLRTVDHDARNSADLVTIGKTSFGNVVEISRHVWEADRIVLTGEIIYHQIAGYSGGRKSLMPGVAGTRTITFNHRMVLDPRCRSGSLEGNPAHEDLLEACRLIEPDFILNVVLTPTGELARAVAGHYEQAHREGCRTVDSILGINLERPYDLVVGSAGGHPLDIDLRQAHKGLENACRALRPGGSILFFAECATGTGSRAIDDYLWRYDSPEAMERALREDFVVGAHKSLWLTRLGREFDIHLVSTLDPALVARCGFQHVAPADAMDRLRTLLDKFPAPARVAAIPRAGFTLPLLNR